MLSKTNLHLESNILKYLSDSELVLSIFREGLLKVAGQNHTVEKVYMTRLYCREKAIIIQYHVYFEQTDTFQIYYGKIYHNKTEFNKYKNKLKPNYYFSIDEYNLIVLFFPYDPKLKTLSNICSSETLDYNIASLLNTDKTDNHQIKNFKILGYRLERRAVIEIETEHDITIENKPQNEFVLKIMKPSKSKVIYEKSILLENNASINNKLSIPKIYGYDEPSGTILMEKIDGTTVHNLIGQKPFEDACGESAKILLKISSVPTDNLDEFSITHELKVLAKQIEVLEVVSPGQDKHFIEAYKILADSIGVINNYNDYKCIHRDFYDKQVIYSIQRTTLLDFDNLSKGDPALDYGNFIAHLYLRMCQSPENAKQIIKGKEKFEYNYNANEQFLNRVSWWESATLLRLAAIYYFRPRWKDLTIHLLRKSICSLKN